MSDLTVLVDARRHAGETRPGTPASFVDVRWDPSPVVLPAHAADYLESRWSAYLQDARSHGKTLFNGPITRLIGATRVENRIRLHVGPADYKTFLVTRVRDRAWFQQHAPATTAAALGNSVLLTHGNRALLGLRAAGVSAYAGRAHLLGGVLDLLGSDRFPANVTGLIEHLLLELHEEAHLALADLESAGNSFPRLLGILQDEFLAQPEAAWQWETRLPLEEIEARIDPREHAGCIQLSRDSIDETTWRRMTPVARFSWQAWTGR
jgi:hypothetical protein